MKHRLVIAVCACAAAFAAGGAAAATPSPDFDVTLDGEQALRGSTDFEVKVGNLPERSDCRRGQAECDEDLSLKITLRGEVVQKGDFDPTAPFRCNAHRRETGLCEPDWADDTFAMDFVQIYYEWNCDRGGLTRYALTFNEAGRDPVVFRDTFRVPRCVPHLVSAGYAEARRRRQSPDVHVRSVDCTPGKRSVNGRSSRWRCTLVFGNSKRRCTEKYVTDFVTQGDTHRAPRDRLLSHRCRRL